MTVFAGPGADLLAPFRKRPLEGQRQVRAGGPDLAAAVAARAYAPKAAEELENAAQVAKAGGEVVSRRCATCRAQSDHRRRLIIAQHLIGFVNPLKRNSPQAPSSHPMVLLSQLAKGLLQRILIRTLVNAQYLVIICLLIVSYPSR